MSGKPAARLSDPTACPKKGHGPNAVASASSDVIIDGLPAARMGDATECGSAIVGAVSGTVFINGQNAAVAGSTGSHDDVITAGSGTVLIG